MEYRGRKGRNWSEAFTKQVHKTENKVAKLDRTFSKKVDKDLESI